MPPAASHRGTELKTSFTISAGARYHRAMFLMTAAALVAATAPTPSTQPVRPAVQARATVRIVSGARLRLGEEPGANLPPVRDTFVRSDGTARPAKLIEFE